MRLQPVSESLPPTDQPGGRHPASGDRRSFPVRCADSLSGSSSTLLHLDQRVSPPTKRHRPRLCRSSRPRQASIAPSRRCSSSSSERPSSPSALAARSAAGMCCSRRSRPTTASYREPLICSRSTGIDSVTSPDNGSQCALPRRARPHRHSPRPTPHPPRDAARGLRPGSEVVGPVPTNLGRCWPAWSGTLIARPAAGGDDQPGRRHGRGHGPPAPRWPTG